MNSNTDTWLTTFTFMFQWYLVILSLAVLRMSIICVYCFVWAGRCRFCGFCSPKYCCHGDAPTHAAQPQLIIYQGAAASLLLPSHLEKREAPWVSYFVILDGLHVRSMFWALCHQKLPALYALLISSGQPVSFWVLAVNLA